MRDKAQNGSQCRQDRLHPQLVVPHAFAEATGCTLLSAVQVWGVAWARFLRRLWHSASDPPPPFIATKQWPGVICRVAMPSWQGEDRPPI